MIRCKGRNGPFVFYAFSTWVGRVAESVTAHSLGESTLEASVELASKIPPRRQGPIVIEGPPAEVSRLLRKIAREVDAQTRAHKARNRKDSKP